MIIPPQPLRRLHSSRRVSNTGFTLIELLAVVAIIAILSGLIFAGASKTLLMTQRSLSASNLRQIGAGFILYANDHQGALPDVQASGGDATTYWWSHVPTSAFGIGVAVDPDLVAELAIQQLQNRNSSSFARKIPQGHFDATNPVGLPGVPCGLFDAIEDALHVARIFSQNAALEHGRVDATRCVVNLTVANDSLVGVEF